MTDTVPSATDLVPDRKEYRYLTDALKERAVKFVRDCGFYQGLVAKAIGVSRATLAIHLKEDLEFKAAIDDALEARNLELEQEARRRAVDGVIRKKYDKDGNILEEERVYSDRLMEKLLEADHEKFKPKNPFAKDGGIGGVLLIPVIPADQAVSVTDLSARLEQLSVKQRALEETEGGTKE